MNNLQEGLIEARRLQDAGDLDGAIACLTAVAEGYPRALKPRERLAEIALARRDFAAFRQHLGLAQGLVDGEMPLSLGLLAADGALAQNDHAGALQILSGLEQAFPDRPGVLQRLARAARLDGDPARALEAAERACAAVPRADIGLCILRLELLFETGGAQALERGLADVPEHLSDHAAVHLKRAMLSRHAEDMETALSHAEAALRVDPGNQAALEMATALCMDLGRRERVTELLAGPLEAQRVPGAVLMLAARRAREMMDYEAEVSNLLRAIEQNPVSLPVLQHLLGHHGRGVGAQRIRTILDRFAARTRLPAPLRLRIAMLLAEFDRALDLMRAEYGPRRLPAQVPQIGQAVAGTGRYRLAQRYLRAAVHHWPSHPAILAAFVRSALRVGGLTQAEAALAEARGRAVLPEPDLLQLEFLCAATARDLDRTLDVYRRLCGLRGMMRGEKEPLVQLLFATLDPWRGEPVLAEIEGPDAERLRGLERVSFVGQIKAEYSMERMLAKRPELDEHAAAPEEGYRLAAAHARAHGNLTRPAVRLLHRFCELAGDRAAVPLAGDTLRLARADEGEEIPRVVYQYWDRSPCPPDIARMMDNWRRLDGFDHVAHDRASARIFLRENFQRPVVQAFLMARGPAEEADYLRLCLLARNGGIWADTDDDPFGDLDPFLAGARGLVLYREAPIGTAGNNFIAAVPRHPVIRHALQEATQALLQRSSEIAWFKTGPGLFTRALGRVLANPPADCPPIRVIDQNVLGAAIAMHRPAEYKNVGPYWAQVHGRSGRLWTALDTALQTLPELSASDG